MSENIQIDLETTFDSDGFKAVRQGLIDYNGAAVGYDDYLPLNLIARDDAGVVIGGLLGDSYWGCVAINMLWVRDDARDQGLGSRLLRMAEEEALRRGCRLVHLDTFDFQALDFYRKYGYTLFGQLEFESLGHTRYYLRKALP